MFLRLKGIVCALKIQLKEQMNSIITSSLYQALDLQIYDV